MDDTLADELHANERTTRAWVRTALSFVAVGLAFGKFLEAPKANEIGGLFAALGFVMMAFGVSHSRRTHRRLLAGTYHPNRVSVAIVSAAFGAVALVLFWTVFA